MESKLKDKVEKVQPKADSEVAEEDILAKMDELRKHSHSKVTDAKLRQGAMIALGLKKIKD